MKVCRDCGLAKDLGDFSPAKKAKDGRTSYCKDCLSVRHRRYREQGRGGPVKRVRNPLPVGECTDKWCPACCSVQALSSFGRNRSSADGLTAYCRPCHNQATRDFLARKGGSRDYHLRRRYGITQADCDSLVAAQGGVCALCQKLKPEHVDQDHVTGRVRGVLCSCCNQGLGSFRDDVASLRAAADYIERTTWQRHQEGTGVYRLTSPRPAVHRSATSSGLQRLICSRRGASCPPG